MNISSDSKAQTITLTLTEEETELLLYCFEQASARFTGNGTQFQAIRSAVKWLLETNRAFRQRGW